MLIARHSSLLSSGVGAEDNSGRRSLAPVLDSTYVNGDTHSGKSRVEAAGSGEVGSAEGAGSGGEHGLEHLGERKKGE